MHPFRQPLVAAAAVLSLAACGPQEPASPSTPPAVVENGRTPAQVEAERTPYQLDAAFARAAADFQVPADLLKAIAHAETRFEMVRGEEEFPGMPAASGLMALRGDKLVEGARLAGVSEEAARTEPEANIRAAAALLASYGRALGVKGEVGEWAPVAAKYSGIDNPEAQAQYVHQSVYEVMRKGVVAQTPSGDVAVSLMPNPQAQARFDSPSVHALAAGPDYAASIWRSSPNYNSRPSPTPKMIVIHTCEGSYSSCWSWLTNSASGVSAHYVVNERGTEVSQLVRESNRAWHVGATYDKNLNGGALSSLHGTSVNNFSVGIEHGGFASGSFDAGLITASSKLSCDITKAHAIPRDSYHIVAHGRLQPSSRTDPGPNWPWTSYLSKVNTECGSSGGGGSGGTSIIIDSNNDSNDTSKYYVEVSSNWTSSSNVAGYYGSGYWAASTASVSDGATFHFYLSAAGNRTVSAWWTSATDRSTTAPFIAYNAAGTEVGRVSKNQQTGGGAWQTLGTYSFTAGWNKVVLSRWTTAGSVVIADAIRVQ